MTRGSLSAAPIPLNEITIDRLESLYAGTARIGECVVHLKPHHTGYRYMRWKLRKYPAHRVVKAISIGSNFPGLVIDHLCKNKACLKLSHLEVVSQGENIRRGTAWKHLHGRPRQEKCKRGHVYTKRYVYKQGTYAYCTECKRAAHMKQHDPERLKEISKKGGSIGKRT